MKILKFQTFNKEFFDAYESEFRHVTYDMNYDAALEHLLSLNYGWANYWAKSIKGTEHEVVESVINAKHLRKKWAAEFLCQATAEEVLVSQIRETQPDVVFIQDFFYFTKEYIEIIRKELRGGLIVGHHCAELTEENISRMKRADIVFTCLEGMRQRLLTNGVKAELIEHAFDRPSAKKYFSAHPFSSRKDRVIFYGSLNSKSQMHRQRLLIAIKLFKLKLPVDIYGTVGRWYYSKGLLLFACFCLGAALEHMSSVGSRLFRIRRFDFLARIGRALGNRGSEILPVLLPIGFRKSLYPPAYGEKLFEILSQYKFALNVHVGSSGQYAGNIRLFETTGCGVCLITDNKKNMDELFAADEVILYSTQDDLTKTIRELIANPMDYEEIAEKGHRRTINDHSYQSRVVKVIETIVQYHQNNRGS